MDHLVDRGLPCVTVLDISVAALDRARERLGTRSSMVRWLRADVTGDWCTDQVDVWHDRAVFHFLTDPVDRSAYRTRFARTLKPGGHAVIATFAEDGPQRCSGLPVVRYSAEALAEEFRDVAVPRQTRAEQHLTPSGGTQSFCYVLFERRS